MTPAEKITTAMFAKNPDGEQECEMNADASIQIIRILSGEEGSGAGGRAMEAAVALADQLGVALQVSPDGSYYDDEACAEVWLRKWYDGFGFDPHGAFEMRREASRPHHLDITT